MKNVVNPLFRQYKNQGQRRRGQELSPRLMTQIKFVLSVIIYWSFTYLSSACTITTDSPVSLSRQIELNIDCGEATDFILSESPTFRKTEEEGIKVHIDSIAPDRTYADITISYPGGQPGGNGIPYSVPPHFREYKVLAVLFTFEDDNGQIAGMPNYATPTWLKRYVFGGDDVSYDGRSVDNSIKQHLEQSTYGRIRMTGEVYPEVVRIPLEKFRKVLDTSAPVASHDAEIIKAIQEQNPTFLEEKNFDFMIALSPDQYAVIRELWRFTSKELKEMQTSIKGATTHHIPMDPNSILYTTIQNEQRTSFDVTSVVTRYNPQTVEGVWLASDTDHTGTNYFEGGSIINHNNWNRFYYISLGVPLPTPETEVIVTYKPKTADKVDSSIPDILVGDVWNTTTLHEFYHEFSQELDFGFSTRTWLGDLYLRPARVTDYDIMAKGDNQGTLPSGKSYRESSYLSAHNKQAFGFVVPYTLNYGENETSIRLHKAEIDDYSTLNQDIRLIKIPLRPRGDIGAQTMRTLPTRTEEFLGEEYLLLEWRYKGALENGFYNFDATLPTEGLVIYHIIESSPFEITGHSRDLVRIMDATPPISDVTHEEQVEEFNDTAESPALFGHESGVMTYIAGNYWQENVNGPIRVPFLLTPLTGAKTVYARFKDADGVVIADEQLAIELLDDQDPIERLPAIDFSNLADGAYISTLQVVTPEIDAPNGLKLIRYYVDGELKKYERNFTSLSNLGFLIRSTDYTNGAHILKAEIYDNGLNKAEVTARFLVGDTSINQPPIANAGIDLEIFDHDNDGVENITLDGTASFDPEGGPVNFEWFVDNVYLGSGPTPIVTLGVGVHTITLTLTDDDDASTIDSVEIRVQPGAGSNIPPIANAGKDQTIQDTDNDGVEAVTLDGSPSSDPDGILNEANYQWRKNGAVIATGESPTVSLAVGIHTLTLTVTDSDGASSNDEVVITVEPGPNTPPIADSGSDQVVTDTNRDGVEAVTLDGSASADPDGGIVSYEWFDNGTLLATGESPVVNLAVGVHSLTLTVTDSDGATGNDEVIITVEPAPNTPPIADAGPDHAVMDSDRDGVEAVRLDGSASVDPDGAIGSYQWFDDESLLASGPSPTASLAVGVHTITLIVTDSDGASSNDEVTITVDAAPNIPPVADAGPDQSVTDTNRDGVEAVTLDASASLDPDGVISAYQWLRNGTVLATGPSPTVDLAVGVHSVTLTITDSDGATGNDEVVITVEPGPNTPPIADAGPNQTVTDSNRDGVEAVILDGSASVDPDGVIDKYQWLHDTTLLATGPSPTVPLAVGDHTLTLKVIDNDGATQNDEVTITVVPAPVAPKASFTLDVTSGDAPLTVNGNASTSSDSDGSIVSYSWDFGDGTIGNGMEVSHTYTGDGAYTIQLTVEDNDGLSNSASKTVEVSQPDVQPTQFPVNLQGRNRPEEATVNLEVEKSAEIGDNATMTLMIYDADFPTEGELFINGQGPIVLFGEAASRNYDRKIMPITYSTPADWWIDGMNTLRFIHTKTAGYRIEGISVDFMPEGNVLPTRFPVKLTGRNLPEEATVNLNLEKPLGSTGEAPMTLMIYDADFPTEGELFVNGQGPIALFGEAATRNNDNKVMPIHFSTSADWWKDGMNTLRFIHTSTAGYRIESITVDFNLDASTITAKSALRRVELTGISEDGANSDASKFTPKDNPEYPGMPVSWTVYEDAEDGTIAGWLQYNEGSVINSNGGANGSERAIETWGNIESDVFRLANEDGSDWDNDQEFFAEFSIMLATTRAGAVYFKLDTDAGAKYLVYTDNKLLEIQGSDLIHINLGDIADGQWHRIFRSLENDLNKAFPQAQLLSVNGIFVYGTAKLDDIMLLDFVQ